VPSDAERDAWVVLASAEGVGPVTFGHLLAAYGSASEVVAAATGRAGAAGLVAAAGTREGGGRLVDAGAAHGVVAAARDADRRLASVRRSGVRVLLLADGEYPSRLRAVEMPPPVLYLRGAVGSLDRLRSVAIVGTRRPTAVGRTMACRIAEAVGSHGATVISGLALGIDAAAHATAVRCGTPTVAVIGGGHERLYPAGHRELAARIAGEGGAVLSEFAPHVEPTRGTFPRRNRLISGLADATVVVEAGVRSGALTTAAWALEQGRDLYLVPGRPDDPAVAGCLAFLREAGPEARVVAGVAELLDDLGYVGSDGPARVADPLAGLPEAERALARCLRERPATVDELVAATGLASATVLAALTGLEVRGMVIATFARYRATTLLDGAVQRRPGVPAVRRSLRRPAA
jgi:DNA processing protein